MPVQNEIVPKVDLCLNDNDLLQVNEIAKQKINLNMSVYQIVLWSVPLWFKVIEACQECIYGTCACWVGDVTGGTQLFVCLTFVFTKTGQI